MPVLRPVLPGPQEREQAPGKGWAAAGADPRWALPGDLRPGTFPSETHRLQAWEANCALVGYGQEGS